MAAARSFIPREGRPFIATALITAVLINYAYGWKWALPVWLAAGLLLYLLRNPSRTIPALPLAVVSPVDGRVAVMDTVRDPYAEREAMRISLLMNPLGAYIARSPIEGRVTRSWYIAGKSLPVSRAEAASENARIVVWLRSDEGDDVVVAVIARRFVHPRCYVQMGQRIGQGQRCGYITWGSRVDVLLPVGTRVRVNVGDHVLAGADVLATLVHR